VLGQALSFMTRRHLIPHLFMAAEPPAIFVGAFFLLLAIASITGSLREEQGQQKIAGL
jgi:hypothetical protein